MSEDTLDVAWSAVEHGATLAQACTAANVRGAAREHVLLDLRRLLAGEARLTWLAPELESARVRLAVLAALDGDDSQSALLRREGLDARTLRTRETELLASADPVQHLAQRGSVSDAVARALYASLGADALPFLDASWKRAPLTLRVNTARTTRDEVAAALARSGIETRPGAWSPWALQLTSDAPLPPTRAFEEGLFEVQDEASQLVARCVDATANAPTVDACAGAGGKTLALCARLGTRGRVVALDPDTRRLRELRTRAARAQAFNLLVHATPETGAALPAPLRTIEGRASRVLVDAPCSGLGALRRKPDLARRVDAAVLARLPDQQFEIAREALRWLRPDGRLVYATCTPLVDENEAVVARLCAESKLVALPLRDWLPPELHALTQDLTQPALRLLPHVHGTDAFTIHVLRRA